MIAGLDIKGAKPLPMDTDAKQPSSAAGIGPWFALGEWAGSGVGAGLNSIRHSDALLQDAGTKEGTVNGIAYQEIGDINKNQIMKDYDREMGMSFLTNPFKGLTMLFGRKKQKNSIRAAQAQKAAINTANMAGASTSYLQQEYAKQYGDLLVPVPPISLQQEFAEKVEAIERQKALIQQSIDGVQTLFDSRMDYWFG